MESRLFPRGWNCTRTMNRGADGEACMPISSAPSPLYPSTLLATPARLLLPLRCAASQGEVGRGLLLAVGSTTHDAPPRATPPQPSPSLSAKGRGFALRAAGCRSARTTDGSWRGAKRRGNPGVLGKTSCWIASRHGLGLAAKGLSARNDAGKRQFRDSSAMRSAMVDAAPSKRRRSLAKFGADIRAAPHADEPLGYVRVAAAPRTFPICAFGPTIAAWSICSPPIGAASATPPAAWAG